MNYINQYLKTIWPSRWRPKIQSCHACGW